MSHRTEIKTINANYTRAEILASRALCFMLMPMFFVGRKKIVLDHNQVYMLYSVLEKSCREVGDIVGHSEDLVYRTIKEIEKERGEKILRGRNHKVYVNRRKYSPDFKKEKRPEVNLRRPDF